MAKTATTRYDVAEHLRSPEEMAAYLEACIEEANGDAAFIAKALGDIARAKGMSQLRAMRDFRARVFTRRSPVNARAELRHDPESYRCARIEVACRGCSSIAGSRHCEDALIRR